MSEIICKNKGEWSELYAFFKLLNDGMVYAADGDINKIPDLYLPIIKFIRDEDEHNHKEFYTGNEIQIYINGKMVKTISKEFLEIEINNFFQRICNGKNSQGERKRSFDIPEAEILMEKFLVTKVSAPATNKIDLTLQIRDSHTGFCPIVGFSVKSLVGSNSTLLNAGKNTRIRYRIRELTDSQMDEINSINDLTEPHNYFIKRMTLLFESAKIEYDKITDNMFLHNLEMIDSKMPELLGECILAYFKDSIGDGRKSSKDIISMVAENNPLHFHVLNDKEENMYEYKYEQLLTASALGMTPGTMWAGRDTANGGYIVVKRNGDVLCYHLYNRDHFKEYLFNHTCYDRPSTQRHDYGYIFKELGEMYINFIVQIRFM